MEPLCLDVKKEVDIIRAECPVCCTREAGGHNYGALSCDACKMFFRRSIVEGKKYTCLHFEDHFRHFDCQNCRFKRCLAIGMSPKALKAARLDFLSKTHLEQMRSLLEDLMLRDGYRQRKLKTFYSTDDQAVENILKNSAVVRNMTKPQDHVVTPDEWAFLALYSTVTHFMKFEFVEMLNSNDKIALFKYVALPLTYFAGLMRTKNDNELEMMSPGGNRIYPDGLVEQYGNKDQPLRLLCMEPVHRLHQLNVTNEEFCFMNMLFFCNPAIPGLSKRAQDILEKCHLSCLQSLLDYCRIHYGNNFAGRAEELRAFGSAILTNSEKLENLFYMFHVGNKQYKFNQLISQTFHFQVRETTDEIP